eukprot:723568-Pyramimonas_sp.AAC.1
MELPKILHGVEVAVPKGAHHDTAEKVACISDRLPYVSVFGVSAVRGGRHHFRIRHLSRLSRRPLSRRVRLASVNTERLIWARYEH